MNNHEMNAIVKQLRTIVADILCLDERSVSHTAHIREELGVDSLDMVEIIIALANIFDIEVRDEDFCDIFTIDDMAAYITTKTVTQRPIVGDALSEMPSGVRGKSGGNKNMLIRSAENDNLIYGETASKNSYKETDIAVIGMACRFPGAKDYRQFWENLVNQVDSVTEIPEDRWDWRAYWGDPKTEANKTNSRWGGFIEDIDKFDPLFFNISPKEANYIDPQHRIILQAIWHAIEDAGYSATELSGQKIGVYVGVSKNDYAELMRGNRQEIVSFVSTGTVHSILANRVSYLLNFRGKSETVDTACSSSLVALHNAIRDIQLGECKSALVGGINALITPTMYISHGKSGMLSPDGRCKTFDATANGYVRGEGVGVVFIKSLDQALKDQDHIIGVIKGSAVNHGGRSNSLTAPNVKAQTEVIEAAIRNAQITPDTITYIETHGTATPLGDPIEIKGLTNDFQAFRVPRSGGVSENHELATCGLGSVKTNIGHLESAAGMAGLIKLLLCFKYRQLPPLLHFQQLNPYIELEETPFFIVDKLMAWEHLVRDDKKVPLRAGLSSFGMGGVNAHVVVEEAPQLIRHVSKKPDQRRKLIPLSAKTETALANYAQSLYQFLEAEGKDYRLEDIAFTLQTGREEMAHRVMFVAADISGLKILLKQFSDKQPNEHIFTGRVTAKQEDPRPIADSDPTKLATQWVKGYKVDWRSLSKDKGFRVPLPVYPFDKRRCWFEDGVVKSEMPSGVKVEPVQPVMRDHATPESGSSGHNYTLRESDYFIRDHRVKGEQVLPGAAYFDIIRSFGEQRYNMPVRVLKEVHWLAPLTVNGVVEAKVALSEMPRSGGVKEDAFEINTRYPVPQRASSRGHLRQVTHMVGKFDFTDPLTPPSAIDLEAIIDRCPHSYPAERLYQQFEAYGLIYGATFRVIKSCHYNGQEGHGSLICDII